MLTIPQIEANYKDIQSILQNDMYTRPVCSRTIRQESNESILNSTYPTSCLYMRLKRLNIYDDVEEAVADELPAPLEGAAGGAASGAACGLASSTMSRTAHSRNKYGLDTSPPFAALPPLDTEAAAAAAGKSGFRRRSSSAVLGEIIDEARFRIEGIAVPPPGVGVEAPDAFSEGREFFRTMARPPRFRKSTR